MTAAPSHRRRMLLGLGLALLAGAGGGFALLRGAAGQAAEDARTRRAVASLLALAELAGRAQAAAEADEGAKVREVVAAWQQGAPAGTESRVVVLSGLRLQASSAGADADDKAAPRRLSRDEKPIFDQGQRLKAAVTANREGEAPKPEVEVERRPGGTRLLAGPLQVGDEVVGVVQVVAPPEAGAAAPAVPGAPAALLAILLPLLGFWLVARALGERRGPLLAAAIAALLLGMGGFAASALAGLERLHQEGHAAVAAHVEALGARAAAVLGAAGLEAQPPLQPGRWDADLRRAPRGVLADGGAAEPVRVAAAVAGERSAGARALVAGGVVALLVLLLVGLGGLAAIGRALEQHRQAYAYVAPAMVGTTVLVFFPFIYGIALSFTDSNLYNTSAPLSELWVGLRNYGQILTDFAIARRGADGALVWNYLNFYWTFLFTVFWTVTNVVFGVSFGLLLALVLNTKDLALRPVYRVLLILPWAMPNYITALIWKGLFHRQFGVVNQLLPILGIEPISWFDHVFSSYFTAFATNAWLSFPFMMVVSLGALQSIPSDIYEAARVDGASRWQQFTAITLPSLKPALVPAVILSVVWTFNMFNIIYLVTAGAPNSATEILITQAYKFAFERYRYGYAAAYATIIFGILLVYGNVQNRITKATEGA